MFYLLCVQLSKRALSALANPDTKDQFDSCMKNWSEWGIGGECVHVLRAVLLLEEEEAELKMVLPGTMRLATRLPGNSPEEFRRTKQRLKHSVVLAVIRPT